MTVACLLAAGGSVVAVAQEPQYCGMGGDVVGTKKSAAATGWRGFGCEDRAKIEVALKKDRDNWPDKVLAKKGWSKSARTLYLRTKRKEAGGGKFYSQVKSSTGGSFASARTEF